MQWSELESNRDVLKGAVGQTWDRLTDADRDEIAGDRGRMLSALQTRYAVGEADAEALLEDGRDDLRVGGEGGCEAARRYQMAQHEFADARFGDKGKKSSRCARAGGRGADVGQRLQVLKRGPIKPAGAKA